ncbi:HD domain-containing protein [Enterobacteriaceae bacterium H11S18]|uniref:HD domain-containing protein n=1 Tax=Dryocola clanedunensis TaxID=2925396 RepID=UPI0022F02EAC|nr:HD domain-containing protein [Dryocola clanedunensis]MCT4711433.1 HD domain-containing protein [Dryocola clanedunensis]
MSPDAFGAMSSVVAFLMEIDKLKLVERRTKIIGHARQENSAEHSWHFAVAAMSLAPFAPADVEISRVVQMALLHDIVEIDVGDVLVYDLAAREAIAEKEAVAAARLFGLLPEPQRGEFLNLWLEYEAGITAEARFAGTLDRILPILQNLHNEGQSWRENNISLEQVLTRNALVGESWPELWQHVQSHLYAAQEKGWLR